MENIHLIRDLNLEALAPYARLTEAQLRSRARPEEGIFIAEGHMVIRHALDSGCEPLSFLMEKRHLEGQGREFLLQFPQIPFYTAEREVLASLTGYALTRGFLCAMRRPSMKTAEAVCRGAKRVAVLENIVDPNNVGAILRSAAALGMDALLLSPSCCDPLHRRAVRVSMGTVFQIPWAYLGEEAAQWPHAGFSDLKAFGFKTAAMALDEGAISIEDPQLQSEEKLAILLGTEGSGLSPESIAQSDYRVIIPMAHGVDSLNVAAAAAVAFWQLRKS